MDIILVIPYSNESGQGFQILIFFKKSLNNKLPDTLKSIKYFLGEGKITGCGSFTAKGITTS